ncbi:hypothetical protein EON81_02855 [bacterium]|nr:MAG: hypothetical protein EON81_02855 [bacterium]
MNEMETRQEAIVGWERFVAAVEAGYPSGLDAYTEGLFNRSMIQIDLEESDEEPPESCRRLDQRFIATTEPWPELRDWNRDDQWCVRRPLRLIDPLLSEAAELLERIARLPDLMPYLAEAARRSWSPTGFTAICRSLEALPSATESFTHPRSAWASASGNRGSIFVRADSPLALVQQEWTAEVAPILEAHGYVVAPFAEAQTPTFQMDYPQAAHLFPNWAWDQHLLEATYRVATVADLVVGTETAV